jgi:hypothetical protein
MAKKGLGTVELLGVGAALGLGYYFFLRPASASAKAGDRVVVQLASVPAAQAVLPGTTAQAIVQVTAADANNVTGNVVGIIDQSGQTQSLQTPVAIPVTVPRTAILRKA